MIIKEAGNLDHVKKIVMMMGITWSEFLAPKWSGKCIRYGIGA